MKLPKSWNEPAFPMHDNWESTAQQTGYGKSAKDESPVFGTLSVIETTCKITKKHDGLTKGEYFTAKAMQSIYVVDGARDCTQKEVAHDAVNLAITTLLELEELEVK